MELELRQAAKDEHFVFTAYTSRCRKIKGVPCGHEQRSLIKGGDIELLEALNFDQHYIIPSGVHSAGNRILDPLTRTRKRLAALEQSHAGNTGESGSQREPRQAEHIEEVTAARATQEVDDNVDNEQQQRRRNGQPVRPIQNNLVKCNYKRTKNSKHCQSNSCSCRKAKQPCTHRCHGHSNFYQNAKDQNDERDGDNAVATADTPVAPPAARFEAIKGQLAAMMTFMQAQANAARPFAQFARKRPAVRPAGRTVGMPTTNASDESDSDPDMQPASHRPRKAQQGRRLPWRDQRKDSQFEKKEKAAESGKVEGVSKALIGSLDFTGESFFRICSNRTSRFRK